MRWLLCLIVLLFLVACTTEKVENEVINMKLKSNSFTEGEMIPSKFTCQGEDINPQLSWEDVPAGVKSFALVFDDPDAPMGTWVHWLVKEIPSSVREINQNSVPGNEVVNSFGKEGYGGPCPPSGVHRYVFKLYALDVSSFEASGKADFYKKVEEHMIAKAELIGKYSKS
jgi:Raf kinase inhibitor-like YbhB/YbcL family protein